MKDQVDEVDDEEMASLMYRLETEVIMSYDTEEIKEIFYSVSRGNIEAEYERKFED